MIKSKALGMQRQEVVCLFVIIFIFENGCLVAQARTSCVVEDDPELVSIFHWMRKEDGCIGRLFKKTKTRNV